MRKLAKISMLGISAFQLCLSPVSAEDLSVTLGVKARFNKLTANAADSAAVFDDSSDTAILLGPSLKLAYKKMFVGVTWLQTVQRRYSLEYYNIGQNETRTTDTSVSEVDALAGYMFHPRCGLFVGYKSISSNVTPVPVSPSVSLDYDLVIKGPAIGVTGNVPLGSLPMLAVASASYVAVTEYSFAPTDGEQKGDGYALEIGVTYDPFEHIAFYLGLKLQQFEADLGDEWKSLGMTLSGDYRF